MSYDITQWLRKQPAWVQEATLLLQSNKTLTDAEFAYIIKILKGEIKPTPNLSKFQLTPLKLSVLRLISLSEVKGIDKLNPRKPLNFGNGNLSVVYGRNGSGKSGYTRILKKICGKPCEPLNQNVYAGTSTTSQACKIEFAVDGIMQTLQWDANGKAISGLSVVDIFDGATSDFYLQQESEAAYTPQEMSIFTQLVSVCEKVSALLENEKNKLLSKSPICPPKFNATASAKLYQGLNHGTTQPEIERLTSFTEENQKNARALQERLNMADPAANAKKQREIKIQIESIKTSLESRLAITTAEFIETLRNLSTDAAQKRQSVNDGAKVLEGVSKLNGIGQETWKALWGAAQIYSVTFAYQGQPFPHTKENARCVLCHQELNDDAKKRLQSFEAFVKGKLETEAKTAEQIFETSLQNLPKVVDETDVRTRFQAAGLEAQLGNEIWVFIDKINALVRICQNKTISEESIGAFPAMLDVLRQLSELRDNAEAKAVQFENDAMEFDRQKAQGELLELEARQWMSQQRDAVLAEVELKKRIQQLEVWKGQTSTRAITTEAGKVSEQLITDAYVARFNSELQKLGASGITVELIQARNVKGKGKYRIQLKNLITSANPMNILSDGEKRIISIAAFLADVTGRDANVPFVFDDPISSLDQEFEERTIDRLIELGMTRQVIVFTHRLSFLSILTDKADGDALTTICINSEQWGTGEPSDIPINAKKPEKALKKLQDDRIPQSRKVQKEQGQEAYNIYAQAICSDFRKLVERIVEVVLLSDVVQRHRRAINTLNKVHNLAKIIKEDCDLIDKMMTKYSCYEHSQSNESPGQLPSPDDLANDIKEVLDWLGKFSERIKS